jgi:pimeloyl-ACP methyl ester carboxylesterase
MYSCSYKSSDGLDLHYLFWPARVETNSCCLLLHGFSNDAHIWDSLAEKLSRVHNVIAVDFRGHGDSSWDNLCNYSHDQLIDDIWRLVGSKPYGEWHVIGHSLGARTAVLMLHTKAFIPKCCIVIDTSPKVNTSALKQIQKVSIMSPVKFDSPRDFYEHYARIYLFAEPARLDLMVRHGLKKIDGRWVSKTDPHFSKALWGMDTDHKVFENLSSLLGQKLWSAFEDLSMPVLLLRGEHSSMLDSNTANKMVNEVIPNGQLNVISDAGHSLMIDNPDDFESSVIKFIKNVKLGRSIGLMD